MANVTVHLEYDQDTECPTEWGWWKLYSFSNKHINSQNWRCWAKSVNGEVVGATSKVRQKINTGAVHLLSYYEHSGSWWSLKGEGVQCRWDTVPVMGVLVWEGDYRLPAGVEKRKEDARSFLTTYNDWANGQCFYYRIEDEEGNDLGSCGGFIGAEHFMESVREAIGDNIVVGVQGDAKGLAEHFGLK